MSKIQGSWAKYGDVTAIIAGNINCALPLGIRALLREGLPETSRNGTVLVAPGPVITTYLRPRERVLFNSERNANPFFHLMEALWMLAGRNDIKFPAFFNKRFMEYSDDGVTMPSAYGHRWREYFGYDQLDLIVQELLDNPNSRRAVLTMWDGGNPWTDSSQEWKGDLQRLRQGTNDVPCNTHVYFDCRGDKLNMTVNCRSNDMLWGAYGANVVHFSILQEYLAARLPVPVGTMRQISTNFHCYLDTYDRNDLMRMEEVAQDFYADDALWSGLKPKIHPLVSGDWQKWDDENWHLLADPSNYKPTDPFLRTVAQPMFKAWALHKAGAKFQDVVNVIDTINAEDWWLACSNFIMRIHRKRALKNTERFQGAQNLPEGKVDV